jgi:hypothetical protein
MLGIFSFKGEIIIPKRYLHAHIYHIYVYTHTHTYTYITVYIVFIKRMKSCIYSNIDGAEVII